MPVDACSMGRSRAKRMRVNKSECAAAHSDLVSGAVGGGSSNPVCSWPTGPTFVNKAPVHFSPACTPVVVLGYSQFGQHLGDRGIFEMVRTYRGARPKHSL